MSNEQGRSPHPELPAELAEFLRGVDTAAVTVQTEQGTELLVMAPRRELTGLRGAVPIRLHHELYERPTAPVIRMVTSFSDRPAEPLAFETFFNVADLQQRREYDGLSRQDSLTIRLYDQELRRVGAKRLRIRNHEEIAHVLAAAEELASFIPAERYDFDTAKQEVIDAIPFPEFPSR